MNPVRVMRTPDDGLQPQVVVDDQVHLVYLKGDPGGCDVFYRRAPLGETNFSRALRVNSEPVCAIALGTVRGAQLALGQKGKVHVVWNGAQPTKNAGARGAPMLYARLDDTGERFEPQRNLMTSTMNLDGGGSVAADADGNVYVVWHAHPRNVSEQDEVHRGVYLARSTDSGKSFALERQVNPPQTGACGCCGLKAFADKNGRLAIVYRAADANANRDMILLVSTNHGQSFESRVLGKWHISTCPMSTQALGDGPEDGLLAMWETEGQVYRAILNTGVAIANPAILPASGQPAERKHPTFCMTESRLLMAWVEGTGWAKGGALAWEWVDLANGSKSSGRLEGVPPWTFPAAMSAKDGSFTIIY
jgi:hypothetical protein